MTDSPAARQSSVMPSRRVFVATLLGSGCTRAEAGVRLRARPGNVAGAAGFPMRVTALKLRGERDTIVYVPASAPDLAPLALYLHGATANEQQGVRRLS